jgi:hypothetical protein
LIEEKSSRTEGSVKFLNLSAQLTTGSEMIP